ncbi:MAG TPA: FAD-dependent oxidoreductase [Actinomycetota bacterium]|nr:FAD-dependent oxidoreductase [Actinomycetota bacterium]
MANRRFVVIGAGVVGAALADELVLRGEPNVTVVDKGPLFATGGSSSHAPGLISRTSTSRFMTETADATVRKFGSLVAAGGPALLPVGTLEVAYTEERLAELWRRWGAARAFGWHGRMIGPDEAIAMWPTIERGGLLGAYATDGEGLAAALRAVEAQAARAAEGGARIVGETAVSEIITDRGAVRGVRTTTGDTIDADVVVCCAGVWGPAIAETVGLTLPMLPTEHQYVVTSPIAELADGVGHEATRPVIRHHDIGIYYRDHGDRVGVGSFHHHVLPVPSKTLDVHARNEHQSLAFGFTPEDFAEAWELTCAFMPALRGARFERRFNGVFGFTPDGYPLIGEHPGLRGFWVAESVWVTHSVGVAQIVADLLCDRDPAIDVTPADLGRFDGRELEPSFFEARSSDQYTDVYVAHHPGEPHASARGVRFSAVAERERALDAAFVDVATWERPQWYETNARLVNGVPKRDAWSSRHWSPIAVAEHRAVRERAGLFDMTPLTRIEIRGAGAEALLRRVVAGRVDRPAGAVTYSVMLNEHGGIVSDVTVSRFDDKRFVLAGNSPRDLAWVGRHAAGDAEVTPVTDARTNLALSGPAARDILQPITDADLSNDAFPYLTARTIRIKAIDVDAVRISYAGELGWELACDAADGAALWDTLWNAGTAHGFVAAGRAALGTLRLEKGYRAWGSDMTRGDAPDAAGLGFTVRTADQTFIGAGALASRPPAARTLRTIVLDDDQVAMGAEPVEVDGESVGFVTSAGWGPTVERSIAYAWLPRDLAIGTEVDVRYFDRTLHGRISPTTLFDPEGRRVRG